MSICCPRGSRCVTGEPDFAETLFDRDFAVIREGEPSASELWYQWKARKTAPKRTPVRKHSETNSPAQSTDVTDCTSVQLFAADIAKYP